MRWVRDLTEESTRHVGMSWTVTGMEAGTGPHLWLTDDHSLYDEVAREGLTLLHLDPTTSILGLVAAAVSRGVPLRVVEVGRPDARAAHGAGMAPIRPDHYVAGRDADAPTDPVAVIDTIRGAV